MGGYLLHWVHRRHQNQPHHRPHGIVVSLVEVRCVQGQLSHASPRPASSSASVCTTLNVSGQLSSSLDAITIAVCDLTNIALSVTVCVGLIGVRYVNAVVTRVTAAILVGVLLFLVSDIRAVIGTIDDTVVIAVTACVTATVAIAVGLIIILSRRTVVTGITERITIFVSLTVILQVDSYPQH